MFYGKFSDSSKKQFYNSLTSFKGIFRNVYAQDNLITFNRNTTFRGDSKFMRAFENNAITAQEKSLIWRLHTLCWAAKQTEHLPGDFVECGVYLGFSMSVISEYLDFGNQKRNLFLYDTFEGIPAEHNTENRSNAVYEKNPDIYNKVVAKFSKYDNISVIKGIVPDSFDIACPDQIAFLHIDMNSSSSEIAALDALFHRVVIGGIIIFDDFGWLGYDKQTAAELEWLAKANHHILELPTGQGLVIKK